MDVAVEKKKVIRIYIYKILDIKRTNKKKALRGHSQLKDVTLLESRKERNTHETNCGYSYI